MSVIARFEVIPVGERRMSTAIASALRALDQFPVSYQTTATDTIIEADTSEQVFAAVQAAHQAIPDDRVITSVEIDEDRRRPQRMGERVAAVQRELGHPPQRLQPPIQQGAPTEPRPTEQTRRGPPSRTR
ncbi:thiamine-binding protein [Halorientalis salina]|uniref:thiamine-binding protein n=1 Tax=Halorientalis salina TaxID=2932266 RepID=UPI0010AD581D|nr:thiamine-binding protein [Halorientalis salina]